MNCIVYYISPSIVFPIQQVVFNCNIGCVDHEKLYVRKVGFLNLLLTKVLSTKLFSEIITGQAVSFGVCALIILLIKNKQRNPQKYNVKNG